MYRLKSNPKTIVKIDEEFIKIVWSGLMEYGYDSRWMISRLNKKNLIKLSPKEVKEIEAKVEKFEQNKKFYEQHERQHKRRYR